MQYKQKMRPNWRMDVDTQCFKFDYNLIDDIKVTLDLQSGLEVDKWRISPRSSLKVNMHAQLELLSQLMHYADHEKHC